MKHRIRVSGILRRGEHILLVQQQNPKTGDRHWGIPGGGLEPEDADIFAGVVREVFEETGLRVRAGSLRFVSEYASSDILQINVWIECHPDDGEEFGEPTTANTRDDDYIVGVEWWPRDALSEVQKAPAVLLKAAFWAGLDAPEGQVLHLGRRSA
jgi:8-oxo-dGTP pyrophosphatase MutT (NUDIX family)